MVISILILLIVWVILTQLIHCITSGRLLFKGNLFYYFHLPFFSYLPHVKQETDRSVRVWHGTSDPVYSPPQLSEIKYSCLSYTSGINLYSAEIFCINHEDQRVFLNLK